MPKLSHSRAARLACLLSALSATASVWATAVPVTVSGRKLLVDGQAYTVQGVNYSPTPYGRTLALTSNGCVGGYQWWTDRSTYVADFPLIARMGANTIRTFDLMNSTRTVAEVLQALDAAQAQGLKVIMGYSMPTFQTLAGSTAQIQADVLTSVANYKDHPAVLMWALGNELNLACDQGAVDCGNWSGAAWFSFLESLASAVKSADPNHPVMTAEGEIPGLRVFNMNSAAKFARDSDLVHLDIWGLNSYRGTSFGGLFQTVLSSTTKPILVSEFGKDAYRDSTGQEDQAMQTSYVSPQWQEIQSNLSATGSGSADLIGGAVFEWTDEWWKLSQNTCFTHDTAVLFSRSGDPVDPNYQDEWFGLAGVLPVDAITNPAGTQRVLRTSYSTMQGFWNPSIVTGAGAHSFFSGTVHNYPNPFQLGGEATKFVVLADEAGTVDLRIYDAGQQFVTSLARDVTAGRTEILWDGRNRQGALVSPGLYFVRIHGKGTHEDTQFRRVVGVK